MAPDAACPSTPALRASAQDDNGGRREAFAALKSGLSASALAAPRALPPDRVIPTAIPALDRLLGGGFPRGALVMLEGNAGRWSIAARLVATVTQRALAAIVDDGGLYPPSLERAGARLDRVLIVPASTPLGIARASASLAGAAALRLDCTLERVLVYGTRGLWCTFAGYDLRVHVRKHHGFSTGATSAHVRAVNVPAGAMAREGAIASGSQTQAPQRRERKHAVVR